VGTRLAAAFRQAGWEVVGVGRVPGERGPGVDVTDAGAVRALVAATRPRVVVNLAAIAHRKLEASGAEVYDAVNHRGVRHLLDASLDAGVERFIQFSSASVYGEEGRRSPVREDDALRPVGPYAHSKVRAEEACLAVDPGRMACVVLRFPAIYAADWLLDVRKRAYVPGLGGRLLLELSGTSARHSLCAVEHAVAFAMHMAHGGAAGVYNVADDPPYTQAEVARVTGALDGVVPRVRVPALAAAVPLAATRLLPGRVGQVVRSHAWKLLRGLVLDTSRAARAGFVPRRRLQDLLPDGSPA
jgi:nucleoside-diphosphate-sugar epimerase